MEEKMKAICQVLAQQQQTTPEEVYRNMQEAVEQAYSTQHTEETRKLQAQVPRHGTVPTPEEVLAFVCENL